VPAAREPAVSTPAPERMLHRLRLILSGLLIVAAPSLGHAVQHIDMTLAPRTPLALIVIEVPGCFYCRVFRRDVQPAYEASTRAREVPMRFLDLASAKALQLAFERPIEVLPTVVLFRGGREVSRIPGYLPPEGFVRVINNLLSRVR
jgi:thioredoxin-related protein